MNLIILLVGLSSGTAHSIYSTFSKALLKNRIKEPFLLFLYVNVIQALVTPLLWIFIRPQFPPSDGLAPLLLSCITCVVAYLFLYAALHIGDVSSVMPIMGSKVIFAGLLAIPMLQEKHSWQVYTAAALVAIAIAMLSYSPSKNGRSRFPLKPVLLMIGCAVIFGFTDIFIKRTLQHLDPYNFMIYYNFIVGVLSLGVIPAIRKTSPLWLKGRDLCFAIYASIALATATLLFVVLLELSGGVVIANILQSTRGIFIVLITAFLTHRGSVLLETQSTKVYALRLAASVLIVISVWIALSHSPAAW
ncbi:MAG TPA: EamA family transporter [Acidobacteriota bacterium]|nr:EamA family transporter [Acidobacteriota bacterium]